MKYIDQVPDSPFKTKTLYFTGGLPGSGKGAILGRIMGEKPEFVKVDPDEIKKDILKDLADKNPALKEQMKQDELWGDHIHEASSYMAKLLMDDALQTDKDIVFDSSMASKNMNKYRKYANIGRENGFHIVGLISNVTPETSIKRAIGRANVPTRINLSDGEKLELTGRLTRAEYIMGCSQNLSDNLEICKNEKLVDYLINFDNNTDGIPARQISAETLV